MNNDQNTLINMTSLNGYRDIVEYLYETCHADVEIKNNYGRTPINNASRKNHLDIVKAFYIYALFQYHYESSEYVLHEYQST